MSSFLQFASERGLIIDSLIYGRWARVPTVDHPQKRNGAYWYGKEFAHCQNWANMEQCETWFDGKDRTPLEQQSIQKRMDDAHKAYAKERSVMQQKASEKAKWILSQCELDRHAYLDSKGFGDVMANVWRKPDADPIMVVPMLYGSNVCGCQLISINGDKKFLRGQRTNDAVFCIGRTGREIICEGYATALSIHTILSAAKIQATIYATFSVGNASRLAKRLPNAFWIADNDHSGVGQTAADSSGLRWWMPPTVGYDCNDWHQEVGLFKASMELKKVIALRRGVI